jgi:uncharacterized repeat protein (TIGR03803 family)
MLRLAKYCFATNVFCLCFVLPCHGIVYHAFTRPINGLNPDGANPAAGLVLSGGVLCSTTVNGGLQGAGTAFYLMPDGSGFNSFRSFGNPPDAANPQGDLTSSGNRFFGASSGGGANGVGAIFVGQTNGSVSIIRSFSAINADTATNSGGASPTALLVSAGGTVFGTATAGGAAANGAVFSLSTNGAALSVLHDFSFLDSVTGTNADGALPWSGLVLSGDALYGTTSAGGGGGSGVVFSIKTNGNNFTILHNFTPMDWVSATNTDGAIPYGGLLLSNDTLFGTTSAGGFGGRGTIFSMQTNGLTFNVLHHFSATDPVTGTNVDGAGPCATLTLSGNTLYGTASAGGTGASGTIYSVKTEGTQFKTLYSFEPLNPSIGTNSDGAFPVAGLLLIGNSLFGTTFSGGPGSAGTVFSFPIPISPATITNIVLNSDRTVTLFLVGAAASTNIIQAATGLASPTIWQNVSTNVADSAGTWQFTDSIATNSSRFYRSYAP